MRKLIAAFGVAAAASAGSVAYAFAPVATPDLPGPEPMPIEAPSDLLVGIEAQKADVPDLAPEPVTPTSTVTTAAPEPVPVKPVDPEPTPTTVTTAPLPGLGAVTLQGDVSLNGTVTLPDVLFGVVWDVEDPSHAQLWALIDDQPTLVCDGIIHELEGEPVYHAQSQLLEPSGRCHGQRVPDGGDGVAIFMTFSDGQWAAATLTSPDGVPVADLFE
ncbi:MAG: hypothetical protein GY929_05455 [Actinomycetia bacterium]|nr:hypothetical protein [Actinomycetes bacterium]